MGNSKCMDALNDAKQCACTCLKRQEELIKVLTEKRKSLSSQKTISNAFKAYNLHGKFMQLKPDKFGTGTYIYNKITTWLNEDSNNSFKDKFGINYDGKYTFKFNNKRLAENILGRPLVKKIIYTNIISKDKNCAWLSENPYCNSYEEFYHPVELAIFCDENFDTNKKYSLEEIKELVENKNIIIESNIHVDAYNYTSERNIDKLISANGGFSIGKVKYPPNTRIIKQLYDGINLPVPDKYNLPKINNIYEGLMGRFDEDKFNYYTTHYYPNLVESIEKEMLDKLNNDIATEKKKAEFIKDYYNTYIKKTIAKYKKQLEEEKKAIEQLSKNEDLYL